MRERLLIPPGNVGDQVPHRPVAGDAGDEQLVVGQPSVRLMKRRPGRFQLAKKPRHPIVILAHVANFLATHPQLFRHRRCPP
jgi:hypothetical protein